MKKKTRNATLSIFFILLIASLGMLLISTKLVNFSILGGGVLYRGVSVTHDGDYYTARYGIGAGDGSTLPISISHDFGFIPTDVTCRLESSSIMMAITNSNSSCAQYYCQYGYQVWNQVYQVPGVTSRDGNLAKCEVYAENYPKQTVLDGYNSHCLIKDSSGNKVSNTYGLNEITNIIDCKMIEGGSSDSNTKLYITAKACTPSVSCGDWGECINDVQKKECNDGCGNITTESKDCTVACVPNYVCGDWSNCIGNVKTRTCTDGCGTNTIESQNCVLSPEPCTPLITCGSWSNCFNNSQQRTCNDGCGIYSAETRSCEPNKPQPITDICTIADDCKNLVHSTCENNVLSGEWNCVNKQCIWKCTETTTPTVNPLQTFSTYIFIALFLFSIAGIGYVATRRGRK